ncbi:MAG TPA: helix-hairpin-helix domain-containing protein [Patescibacteria group bacterium]|jgi:competence protein ComEA|nr:helix-hairpin-helix domain-containing protein [Patescibacteria group bacterium]
MTRTRKFALIVLALTTASLILSAPAAAAPAGPDARQEAASGIDINSASVEELMSVQGIGQVIAQRIVEFREKNGPYKTVDDLLKVQGIGEKSLTRIREKLVVGKPRK